MKAKAYKLAKVLNVFSWILAAFYVVVILLQLFVMIRGIDYSNFSYVGYTIGMFLGVLLAYTLICGIGFVVLRGLAAALKMLGDLHEKAGLSVSAPQQNYGPQDLQTN